MTIVINKSWQGQRVTGQQRYAQEISRRLLAAPGVVARPSAVPSSRVRAWMSAQGLAVPRAWGECLVTLTSRGPLWHPKHVVTIHDHFVLTNPEWYSPRYVATHAPLLRAQISGARGLIFVSDSTRKRHHSLFGDRLPSVVAPNGVNPPLVESSEPPVHLGHPFFLGVGSRDPRKNTARLIRAYEALPKDIRESYSLVLVGGADSSVFAGASSIRSGNGVVLLDYVTDEHLWSLYRRAVALVMPSIDEGFGLPLVEAAAVGTPLIVSDIPVFRWIAGDSAVYFDPLDRVSITDALAAVVSGATALPAPPDVSGRFNWGSSSASILEFVRKLD